MRFGRRDSLTQSVHYHWLALQYLFSECLFIVSANMSHVPTFVFFFYSFFVLLLSVFILKFFVVFYYFFFCNRNKCFSAYVLNVQTAICTCIHPQYMCTYDYIIRSYTNITMPNLLLYGYGYGFQYNNTCKDITFQGYFSLYVLLNMYVKKKQKQQKQQKINRFPISKNKNIRVIILIFWFQNCFFFFLISENFSCV